MGWLQRLLIKEQDFTVDDYLQKYPEMDPQDAEVLGALNKLIRENRAQEKRNDIPEEWE